MSFRSGTVALVGRPNAGKSSLLNALVGERIAAVSRRPQTTRTRVLGLWNTDAMQVVLLDTPGIHEPWTELNRRLVAAAEAAIGDADLVLWIIDAEPLVTLVAEGQSVFDDALERLRTRIGEKPLVVVLNKVDLVEKKALLPVMQALGPLGEIVPISALKSDGVEALARVVATRLPEQEALYPTDQLTDVPERTIVAELIREQVFERCGQEVPYASAVEIERFDESQRDAGKVHIYARIIVEKESQKAILIGKGGAMVKSIGIEARRRIERLLDARVRLDLFIAVEKDWTKNPRMLKEQGIE
jgi:GTP-binding protein Era